MTDQPTQDAIVSQRDYEMAERLEENEWPGNHAAWTHIIAQHFATYRAEIEAATIERCAAHFQAMHNAQPSMENYCFMTYDCIAEDLRNLKGQTS